MTEDEYETEWKIAQMIHASNYGMLKFAYFPVRLLGGNWVWWKYYSKRFRQSREPIIRNPAMQWDHFRGKNTFVDWWENRPATVMEFYRFEHSLKPATPTPTK